MTVIRVWLFVLLVGMALSLASAAALIYQALIWLEFGHWPSIDLHDLIAGHLQTSFDQVLFWLDRLPGVVGLLVGSVLALGGARMVVLNVERAP
jgi:hypothetical protein